MRAPPMMLALAALAALVGAPGCAAIAGLGDSGSTEGAPAGDTPGTVTGPGEECATIEANITNADFGEVRAGGSKPGATSVTLRNTGASAATLTPRIAGPGTATFVADLQVLTLGPGESRELPLGFHPQTVGRQEATLGFDGGKGAPAQARGAVCSLPEIKLGGTGSDQAVLVQPGVLDFGAVDCGTQPPAKPILVTSDATEPFTFTASALSPFMVDRTSGSVDPGGTVQMFVTPARAPMKAGDLVTGHVTVVTSSSRKVDLLLQARGADLEFSPKRLDYTREDTKRVTVRNAGNAPIGFRLSVDRDAFKIRGGDSATLVPKATQTFDIELDDDDDPARLNVAVQVTSGVLCRVDTLVLDFPGK